MWSHWGRCLLVHLQGDFICKFRGWQCWEVLLRFTATVSTKLRLILCCKWHLSMRRAVLQLQKCSPLQLKSLILMTNQTSKHHQRSPNIHIYPLLRILTLWVDSRRSWSQTHVIQTYPNSKPNGWNTCHRNVMPSPGPGQKVQRSAVPSKTKPWWLGDKTSWMTIKCIRSLYDFFFSFEMDAA